MEVVGGVASIITFIEATGVLAGVSKDLVLRWRDAPREIQALATRLSLLAAELQSIKNATARSHPILTDAIIRQSLSDLLTDVRKRLTKLESLHFRLEQSGTLRQKFQWTVKDAGSAEKMLNRTQEVEQRLANLMTLISLRAQTPILDGLDRIEQMVSTLVVALPASAPASSAILPTLTAHTTSKFPTQTGSGLATKRAIIMPPWTIGKVWGNWGFRGAFVTTKQGYHTDYNINFSVSLPIARILGSYALMVCLSLRSTPLCRSSFTFRHPSYFAMARVVEADHPFILACDQGDLETVRFMLRSGEGRPTDMTADGCTPMFYASRAGSVEVVAELLECGVEVDMTVDLRDMTTMLEISSRDKNLDLVRFLLQRGASADHTNSRGLRASGLCWYKNDLTTKHSSVDIYNVLSESTHIDLVSDEDHCYTTFAIAVMNGCGSQIDSLVRFGYDICRGRSGRMLIMGLAAEYGNFSAYSALVSNFGLVDSEYDTETFLFLLTSTILGKARYSASRSDRPRNYDEMLRNLLQRSGDDRILPLPLWLYSDPDPDPVLSVILSKEMEAEELAAALGPETEAWYLGMVRSSCILGVHEEDEVMQRLRELSSAGHVTTGFIYESAESDEPGGYRECESGGFNEDSALTEDIDEPDTGDDSGHESGTGSEADELDQFWDASESVS